jgi:hypothetical protein
VRLVTIGTVMLRTLLSRVFRFCGEAVLCIASAGHWVMVRWSSRCEPLPGEVDRVPLC